MGQRRVKRGGPKGRITRLRHAQETPRDRAWFHADDQRMTSGRWVLPKRQKLLLSHQRSARISVRPAAPGPCASISARKGKTVCISAVNPNGGLTTRMPVAVIGGPLSGFGAAFAPTSSSNRTSERIPALSNSAEVAPTSGSIFAGYQSK